MVARTKAAWHPTSMQELLLRAALEDGESARDAWLQWIAKADVDRLDSGSHRLLPMLYQNLRKLGVEHPELKRFGGVYRHTWVTNQLTLRHLPKVIGAFEKKGIPTVLLKGAAMAVGYYDDVGKRPMVDLDVLVPTVQSDAAIQVLLETGWLPQGRTVDQLSAPYRTPHHAMGFGHEVLQMSLDLHWHVSFTHLHYSYDEPFWAAATPIQVDSVTTHLLCPTDQIIHTCFNGLTHELGNNIRWLPDVLCVFAREPEIDWKRFVVQCQRMAITLPMQDVMEYLRTVWDVPVPTSVIRALAGTPVGYRTRQLGQSVMTWTWDRTWMQVFWLLYNQYLSTIVPAPVPGTLPGALPRAVGWLQPLGFIRFLQQRWLVDSSQTTLKGGMERVLKRFQKSREYRTQFPSGHS
jgi:hypothetical protein